MKIIKRINAFLKLGDKLKNYPKDQLYEIFEKARIHNPWFTFENIELAFEGLFFYLQPDQLEQWLANYQFTHPSKKVGVIMAGNIPMVAMHDILCVLLSGHRLQGKLSSQDKILIPFVLEELIKIEPLFGSDIEFADRIKNFDAVIATGSNNSARYFNYYFSKVPHIIRKNRVSVAVLNGKESVSQIKRLGDDIFQYFGLGCRNVSKIFLPFGYRVEDLLDKMPDLHHLTDHHKYANNYDYNRAIYAVNKTHHFDNGYALFTRHQQLASPISVVYYDYYEDLDSLHQTIRKYQEHIQCVVSDEPMVTNRIPLGKAQKPEVWDYADNIDTMSFLTTI